MLYNTILLFSKRFSKKIAIGLALSSAGDAFLVWPDLFLPGMLAFSLAHMVYISNFGWRPLFPKPGALFYFLVFISILSTSFSVSGESFLFCVGRTSASFFCVFHPPSVA